MEQEVKALAEKIHFCAGIQAQQNSGGNIEADFSDFRRQVDLAAISPVVHTLCDDRMQEGQTPIHERPRECWIHEGPVARVLGRVHVRKPFTKSLAKYRGPTLVVAEVFAVSKENEAVCLGPNKVCNFPASKDSSFRHKGKDWSVGYSESSNER
jgi:hypothetical protein